MASIRDSDAVETALTGALGTGPRRRRCRWPSTFWERRRRDLLEVRRAPGAAAGTSEVGEGTGELLPGQVLGHGAAAGTRWEEGATGRPWHTGTACGFFINF
jgi:hypothetical protein